MKYFLHNLVLLMLLLGAQSCFQKSSKVSLKLTSSFSFGGANMSTYSQGGLMVWGQSSTGKSFGRVLTATDGVSIQLENGTWSFYAMAWQTPGTVQLNATDAIRCAVLSNITLTGEQTSANLNLTELNCAQPIFAGNLLTLTNSTLQVKVCDSVANIAAGVDMCTNDRTNANHKADRAPVRSVRFTLEEYTNGVPSGTGLSRCISISDTLSSGTWATPAGGALVLPAGDSSGANPFRLKTELYLGNTPCEDPTGVQTLTYVTQGFTQNTSNRRYFNNGTAQHVLFFEVNDTDLCSGGRATLEPFAAGVGQRGSPYVICSAKQFYNTLTHINKYSNSYLLAADIDLNPHTKGITNAGNLSTTQTCWEPGQNFQPIGSDYSSCSLVVSPYTGNFDGNNHTISNLRMRFENTDSIGFLGNWAPTPPGFHPNYVRDLRLIKPEVGGKENTGTLIGQKSNSETALLSGLKITEVDLRGRGANVGGVIGSGTNVSIEDVFISGLVEGDGSKLGGVFGILNGAITLKKIKSQTGVETSYDVSNVGGIGGELSLSGAVTLSEIAHEGAVSSRGTFIGGLFGRLFSMDSYTIENFYSKSAIFGTKNFDLTIGGIVGHAEGTAIFSNGYFAGSVLSLCSSSCVSKPLSGFFGSGTLSQEQFFYLYHSVENMTDGIARTNDASVSGLLNPTAMSGMLNTFWVQPSGSYPRLTFESHPCALPENNLSLAAQTTRGSQTNPKVICKSSQWYELGAENPGTKTFYKIRAAVNLSIGNDGLRANTPAISTIHPNVVIDGSEGLVQGFYRSGADTTLAPILNNTGELLNLRMANTHVKNSGTNNAAGVARINSGKITGLKFFNSLVEGTTISSITAGVVGTNMPTGEITKSRADVSVRGWSDMSGFVQNNQGKIHEIRTYIELDLILHPVISDWAAGMAYAGGQLVFMDEELYKCSIVRWDLFCLQNGSSSIEK